MKSGWGKALKDTEGRDKILSFAKNRHMWQALGKAVLKYRIAFIIGLLSFTGWMGYHASKVQMSYDFSRAIPTDHPKYLAYLDFKKTFGEDGNLLTIGFITDSFFTTEKFNQLAAFQQQLKGISGVEDILSINGAASLKKNDSTGKLDAIRIFPKLSTPSRNWTALRTFSSHYPFTGGYCIILKPRPICLDCASTATFSGQKQGKKQLVKLKRSQRLLSPKLDMPCISADFL